MKTEIVSLKFWCSSMLLCLCYASVIVLLCFCYCFIMFLLYFHWNEIVIQLYSLSYSIYIVLQIIMQQKSYWYRPCFYLTNVNALKLPPQGVSIRTWLRAVQESGYVLGNIETKTVTIPRARSRSALKAKLAALEMRAHPKNVDKEEILADIPRGEKNRNPTEKQYSIPCPSFGLGNCTKTFCVAKKWWYLRPWIVTVIITIFLCTGPFTSREFTTLRKYYTWYWRWQTTTFVILIIIISLSMEGIINLNSVMMKIVGGRIRSRQIQVLGKQGTQGSLQIQTTIPSQ